MKEERNHMNVRITFFSFIFSLFSVVFAHSQEKEITFLEKLSHYCEQHARTSKVYTETFVPRAEWFATLDSFVAILKKDLVDKTTWLDTKTTLQESWFDKKNHVFK